MNIQDIRKQYPQYNDLSDQNLAAGFHKKFYSDLPFEDFAKRIGLGVEPTAAAPTAAPITTPEEAAPAEAPTETKGLSKFQQFLEAAKPEPFTRQVLDIPLKATEGIVSTTRAATELFGANNVISKNLRGVEEYLADLASAQSKQDTEKVAQIMKEAEDKGVGEQLKAVLQAFATAPLDMLSQAAGSTVPILLGAVAGIPGVLTTSAAVGTGVVKGSIYDTVKGELVKAGTPPNVAEERAQAAQAYGGKNLDMILAGTALGTLAGRTGVERLILNKIVAKEAAEKGAVSAAARGAVEEAAPEFLQAAQERLAENIALQREGFDVPTMRGVVGAGGLEAITGGALGAGVGVATRRAGKATAEDALIAELDKTLPGNLGEDYEQRTVTPADTSGRIEPSLQIPSEQAGVGGVAPEPTGTEPGGVALPGVPPSGPGVGAETKPTPLSSQFTLRPELTPQEKTSAKHYAALQKQPDNPVTQSLTALDTSIQKAQDAYAQIAEKLGIPSSKDMMGLGVLLPTPIAELFKYPSAAGSAVRLVNASKSLASGAKRGSSEKLQSAIKQVQKEIASVDKVIADALTAAEDPNVQAQIDKINEQNAVSKGIAARQAEIAAVPMGQRDVKMKEIEDQVRAELKAKKAKVVDITPKLEAKEDAELEAGILEDEQRRGRTALTPQINNEIQEALNLARQAVYENSTIEKRGPTFFPEDTTTAQEFVAGVHNLYKGLEEGTLPNAVRSIEILREQANALKQTFQQRIADREAYEKRGRPDLKLVSKAPTAQELEDTGAIFENELEPAKDFFTGDNDVYGVDTEGNTTKLANPEELAAFHEANKDKAEPDFTAGDAGYYVVPRERAAPATVPDAPTIKENNDAVEELNYRTARDNFLNGQFDVYHIDPEENVVPVTSLKQLQQLNAEWQGDPDAGFWSVPKAEPREAKFAPEPAKEAEAMEKMLKAGKLNPLVAEAIFNNDITSALRTLADRLTNPLYKELATRLADLNLPTTIGFDNARDLTRRQIDLKSGKQQKRLFSYIQLTYPDLYKKYFTSYDQENNLEKVYDGLKDLRSGKYNLQPVIAEFTDVNKAYEDNIRGLGVAGAYYPAFDAVTLSAENATNDVLLHEVLHAATEAILEADPATLTEGQRAARADLERMYKYAVEKIPLDLYGLTDIHEFISEVFTNKSFQDRLRKIPYTPEKVPFFTKLVRAIYRMIGIDNLAGNAMTAASQLFSAVRTRTPVAPGARFAPKGKRVRGPISTTWRTAEQVAVKTIDEVQNAIKGHTPWSEMLPQISGAMWDAGNTVFRKAILGFANLRQIDDLTKTKFPQISGAIRIIEQMIADRNRTMTKAKDILNIWTKAQAKNPGQSRLMGRVMLEATIRGIDPDTAKAGVLNPPLQAAWDGLDPEFKNIYRQVRNFYADSINTMIAEMKRRAMQLPKAERQKVIKEINQKFGPDKLVKPYFPLRRFGNYWFQVGKGNFKEFYEFESAFGRERAFRKRKAELEKGNAKQRDLAETMRKGNGISELYNQNASSTQVLKEAQELVDNVTSTNVADVKKELKESLDQLIYILLPQQSVRKMFINRQAIQGASEDMLRVFATTAVHTAYQQSRFKYAEKFVNNLINAKEYIKELPNSDIYDDYIKEVEKRVPTILSNEDTSMSAVVAGKLSDATFYFMLSAPFSAMLNLLGMAAITMPYIGGRYGYAKTNATMLKYLGRYSATMPKRSIAPALKGQFMQMEFPSIVEGGNLDPLMQRAADRFIEDNDINISQTNDIMDIGGRPSELYTGRYNTVKRVIAALFHQSERLNREVTLMSTFELAYDKFLKEPKKDLRGVIQRDKNGDPIQNTPDEAFELAITEAKDIAGLSLGDFTRQMKPRYFTPPLLSVITKFKQYSVLATYVTARNFYFTVAAPFRKGEIEEFRQQMLKDGVPQNIIDQRIAEADAQRIATYKEGRRRLAGILGMTYLFGGAEALPFFTLGIGTLVKMLGNDDDDEFFDWDNWFKNYMEVELGGYVADLYRKMGAGDEAARKAGRATMESVVRGPASVITGGALSERVSLDPVNLWLRDPRFSTDTRESVVEGAIANAGPVVGLMVNWAEAVELMEKGQYQRAFEKAAPAIIAKPASAARLSEEGAKTQSGVTLVDNLTAWEIAMQAVGLQPERVAQKQKAAIEAKTYEQKVIDKRNTLMDRLWLERGNTDSYGTVIEQVTKFNQRYPEFAIEPNDVVDSFKRRGQSQMEADIFGAQIQKKLRPRVSPMLEYGRE